MDTQGRILWPYRLLQPDSKPLSLSGRVETEAFLWPAPGKCLLSTESVFDVLTSSALQEHPV